MYMQIFKKFKIITVDKIKKIAKEIIKYNSKYLKFV